MSARTFCNGTGQPTDLSWCTNADHYTDGHPDPDGDVRTVTVAAGAHITFDDNQPNADDILAEVAELMETT